MKEKDLKNLPPLSLPIADLKLKRDDEDNLKIYDILRKKFVSLTPEEFVRQNFVNWLINQYGYRPEFMANETEVKLNGTKKRCDTIVFGRECEPLLIVEYKAPNVEISQETFDQIVRYNMILKAKYLIVSNGIRHYCCKIDYANETYYFIRLIPSYEEAKGLPGVN